MDVNIDKYFYRYIDASTYIQIRGFIYKKRLRPLGRLFIIPTSSLFPSSHLSLFFFPLCSVSYFPCFGPTPCACLTGARSRECSCRLGCSRRQRDLYILRPDDSETSHAWTCTPISIKERERERERERENEASSGRLFLAFSSYTRRNIISLVSVFPSPMPQPALTSFFVFLSLFYLFIYLFI